MTSTFTNTSSLIAGKSRRNSRGVALIFTLLLLTLLMALSLGMAISIGSQTFIAGYYRNYRGAFYAADSGLNVARQALINNVLGSVPTNVTVNTLPVSSGEAASAQSAVATSYTNFTSIDSGQAASSWPASFKILNTASNPLTFALATNGCQISNVAYVGPAPTPTHPPTFTCSSLPSGNYQATAFTYTYNYTITSVGEVKSNEQTTITETGNLQFYVSLGAPSGVNTSFAAWGMFINTANECDGTTLVPGTLTGPVSTNGGFTFQQSTYNFTDPVTFGDSGIGYTTLCPSTPTSWNPPPSGYSNVKFNAGLTLNQPAIALPVNDFSQKWAALDGKGTGEANSTPQPSDMNAALKNVSSTSIGIGNPYPTSGTATGVYLPYQSVSGVNTMQGGGIYIEGSVTSMTLTASTSAQNHSLQVITVKQGSTTTTITEDLTAQTTSYQNNGGATTTIAGLPENYDNVPATPATMVYVDGNIGSGSTGLSGPESGGASSGAAIQNNSEMTITASGNVDITGDIKYATEPVTTTANQSVSYATTTCCNGDPLDTLIPLPTSASTQVLGIFTATGNVNLVNQQSNSNLEIDGSVATISASGSGAIENTGNSINTLNIVGGRIQNTIQNIGATTRNVYFDRRFLSGGFAPPWFPSTSVTPGGVAGTTVTPTAIRLQWINQSATLN
jgi:Tfp pilus assembly protein PilX